MGWYRNQLAGYEWFLNGMAVLSKLIITEAPGVRQKLEDDAAAAGRWPDVVAHTLRSVTSGRELPLNLSMVFAVVAMLA